MSTHKFLLIIDDNNKLIGVLRYKFYDMLENTKIWDEYHIDNYNLPIQILDEYLSRPDSRLDTLFTWNFEEGRWHLDP